MTTETNHPHNGSKPYANPYLAGILLGLVLLASFVILGAGLGASGGIARIAAALSLGVAAPHTLGSEYFGKWGARPLNYYLVLMFVGTFVGALFSALLANRARIQVERGAAISVRGRDEAAEGEQRVAQRSAGEPTQRLGDPEGLQGLEALLLGNEGHGTSCREDYKLVSTTWDRMTRSHSPKWGRWGVAGQ